MSGNQPTWQLFRKKENDSSHALPPDIPTQPKNPWSSVKENSILHMLDDKTREYRSYAETMPTNQPRTENSDKKKKFGSFMGKLLLQSGGVNKPAPKVLKEKVLKQQVLTEEPFAGLFRMRKNRNDQAARSNRDGGVSKDEIKFSLKLAGQTSPQLNSLQLGNNNNNIKTSKNEGGPKYRLVNGRRTRWDIQDPTHSSTSNDNNSNNLSPPSYHQPKSNDDVDMDNQVYFINSDDDENFSSVDSLQSDDDVLGPWIELGMVKPTELNKLMNLTKVSNAIKECQECIENNINKEDRSPLDEASVCSTCRLQWNNLLEDLVTKIESAPVEVIESSSSAKNRNKKQKKVKFNDNKITVKPIAKKQKSSTTTAITKRASNNTPSSTAIKNNASASVSKRCVTTIKTTNKYTKLVIPPIKSRHSQKTNRKIMASKKNENITITETPKQKEENNMIKKNSDSHFTTGAFMTRRTAKTLADPEYGFYPNPHGFVHRQSVEVLNINGYWYRGTLEMMDKGKVKVKYNGWDDQDEWIIMGSRRLRAISAEEESTMQVINQNNNSVTADEYIDVTHVEDDDDKVSFINEDNTQQFAAEGTERTFAALPIISVATTTKQNDDYVSSTLDKDPTQIFNNNEVFMTRSMARGLVDEHGFKPNSFGYRRNRAVTITFYSKQSGGRKMKQECVGYLREMHQDQVRVWYPNLHQSEWLPVGSRRLRVMTEEEEKAILFNNNVDFDVQEVPPTVQESKGKEKEALSITLLPSKATVSSLSTPSIRNDVPATATADAGSVNNEPVKKKGRGRPKKTPLITVDAIHKNQENTAVITNQKGPTSNNTVCNSSKAIGAAAVITSSTEHQPIPNATVENTPKIEEDNTTINEDFLTTGAFATRRAMRQLKDKNGFTPNPYGYTNNLAVEILNTRSGKNKFWECGRLVAMRPGQVRVHYEGWADVYDEWFMVGSRRIRIATQDDTTLAEETTTAVPQVDTENTILSNDLLIPEYNPELTDKANKNRKHQLVRPQDYQELGMLVNLEELAAKEAQKKERRGKKVQEKKAANPKKSKLIDDDMIDDTEVASENEDEGAEYLPDDNTKATKSKKNTRKRKSAAIAKKKSPPQAVVNKCGSSSCHNHDTLPSTTGEDSTNDKQIISLRLAQAKASKNYKFVANVYGYDYMQHVTVLHLDKKLYEGRLVSMHKNKVKIHYCGWLDAFDEYINLGSRRLQPIENDHEVECIEPNYRERYEQMLLDQSTGAQANTNNCDDSSATSSSQQLINRLSRKRMTLDDTDAEEEAGDDKIEYHKDPSGEEEEEVVEINAWKVYCNQCNVVIKQFRYYCTYCETPSVGHDYQSFELCLRCFDQNFPFWHEHPRSSFAIQAVIDAEIGPRPIKGELVTVWEEDILEEISANNETVVAAEVTTSGVDSQGNVTGVTNAAADIENMMEIVQLDESNTNTTCIDTQPLEISSTSIATTTAVITKSNNIESGAIDASKVFTGNVPIDTDQGYKYLKRWRRRKVCAFCNDDDDTSEELGQFIGPFVIATFNKNGVEKKRSFWAHDSCARYSPEVFCTPEGKWYNVTLALRRGRGMKCHGCKEKGATIGCFESKCNKSFHLPCSQKPVSYFKSGVIFWCGIHEAYYNKKDTYVNIFNCDGCSKKLEDESWFTCVPCASSYFSSFDLCAECYEKFPSDHAHNEDEFEETSFAILKEMEAQKATEAARAKEEIRAANAKKKKKPLFPRRRRRLADGSMPVSCCYCGTYEAESWRKGYDGGVIMCNPCFELALLVDNDGKPCDENMPLVIDNSTIDVDQQQEQQLKYVASIEDYSHKPYLTRDTLSATKFSDSSTGPRLASYEPQPNQLFSLTFDSTYFDIPGRAPRWATHSGTDYHGTWLPQTVRRAILKYTSKDERVLSNFLGRGTDAIECFLLQRRCCGVDINPAAVALSQRNCCFEIPPGLTSAEYRPIVAQADSRKLSGALFSDESYHHILSHPPYKDCVAYSTHLDGDLSRFTSIEDFKIEYTKVVQESWRLLKMDRRLTLGIGDNREHCFYIPVGFHLIRLYIDQGFELEELVIKRQRYCSAFGLGTYLCVQFDFLVFTHEFIATFKKVPKENTDKMMLIHIDQGSDVESNSTVRTNRTIHGVPSSAIMRKSVVMGTVWVFKPTDTYGFDKLCISRMVERFGKDDGNWEHIELLLEEPQQCPSGNRFDISTSCCNPAEQQSQVESSNVGDELLIDENPLSEYEQQRLKRIEENNKTLLKLGLISELSEESDDVIHYETMMNKEYYKDGGLVLMVTGHRSDLLPSKINNYRQTIVELAVEATTKLATKGMLIIGTQDIRDAHSGKLWPMTMLVLEDIEREVGRNLIKLKEMVVTVPDGYSKDRKRDYQEVNAPIEEEEEVIDIETVNHEYVPIVHAIYLIFQKL